MLAIFGITILMENITTVYSSTSLCQTCVSRIHGICLSDRPKVGRSKPPPVLTSGFNRLKPPGQYAKKWSILVNMNLSGLLKILSGRFSGGLRY